MAPGNLTSNEAMSMKVIQLFLSAVSSVKTLSFYVCPIFNDGVMGPVECYSCMSMSYQNTWGLLRHVYHRPHSFTDKCNDPFLGKKSIGTVNCSNICVVLKEPQFSAGVFLGHTVIRGCLDRLLIHGFNQTAVDTHRFRHFDVCRNLPRAHLMRPAKDGIPMQGEVQMCACYGNRCNSAQQHRLASLLALLLPICLLLYRWDVRLS